MSVFFQGLDPETFFRKEKKKLVLIINEEATQIESEVVADTPANTGRLKGSWTLIRASFSKPTAIVQPTLDHFLPVEIGRSPGKGISREGQENVSRWGQLVLGQDSQESRNFAYLLSEKYKREGRKSTGFVGLIKPGIVPQANYQIPDEPVKGSLLDNAFNRLRSRLNNA